MTDEQLVWMQVYAEMLPVTRDCAAKWADRAVEDFRARWPMQPAEDRTTARKPTIAELEDLLARPDSPAIQIGPNGELTTADADWRTLCEQNLVRRIVAWIQARETWSIQDLESEFLK